MFQNINEISYINGQNGIYDSKIKNNSVRYARNAVSNYQDAYSKDRIDKYNQKVQDAHTNLQKVNEEIEEIKKAQQHNGIVKLDNDTFQKKIKATQDYIDALAAFSDNTPEAKFNMKYAQNEAGKPDKMAVLGAAYEELGKKTSISVGELTETLREGISDKNKFSFSADSLDLNQDGKIDIAEYGTSILVEDMLSTDSTMLNAKNITGEITQEGQNALLSFAAINNYSQALNTYKAIYSDFNLGEAQSEFLKDKNNLI